MGSDQCVQRERLRCRVVAVPADRVERVRRAPYGEAQAAGERWIGSAYGLADRVQAGDDQGSVDEEAAQGIVGRF